MPITYCPAPDKIATKAEPGVKPGVTILRSFRDRSLDRGRALRNPMGTEHGALRGPFYDCRIQDLEARHLVEVEWLNYYYNLFLRRGVGEPPIRHHRFRDARDKIVNPNVVNH